MTKDLFRGRRIDLAMLHFQNGTHLCREPCDLLGQLGALQATMGRCPGFRPGEIFSGCHGRPVESITASLDMREFRHLFRWLPHPWFWPVEAPSQRFLRSADARSSGQELIEAGFPGH